MTPKEFKQTILDTVSKLNKKIAVTLADVKIDELHTIISVNKYFYADGESAEAILDDLKFTQRALIIEHIYCGI